MAEKPIQPRPQPTPGELTERQLAAAQLAAALVAWWRTFPPPEPDPRPDKPEIRRPR